MPSKEIDKEQEKAIDQRPNYFAGQYLLEDDFQLEQKYHIDRQRRHNRLLHVSGIAEGLKVSKNKDWAVKVSAGTAIDSQGRQIILPGDQPVDLGKIANTNELKDSEYTLSIRYKEELTEKQDSEENTHRRVQEKPAFELSTSTTPDVIPIAKLIIKGGKVESIDSTERVYSGICLPTENGKGVTLRSSHGDDKPNLAVLTGSLSISGGLEVKGESTLTGDVNANGSLTVKGNTTIEQELKVKSLLLGESGNGVTLRSLRQDNQNLAMLEGSLSISGKQEVKGESTWNGKVTAKGGLKVENNMTKESIARFEQTGTGAGVYIGGSEEEKAALLRITNINAETTLYAENLGKGYLAYFNQKGKGGGVNIRGIQGKQNAINVYENSTDSPTIKVENNGTGPTIQAEQKGEGLAAKLVGDVEVTKELRVENIDVKHITKTITYKEKDVRTDNIIIHNIIHGVVVVGEEYLRWTPGWFYAKVRMYNVVLNKTEEIIVTKDDPIEKNGITGGTYTKYEKGGWRIEWEVVADKYKRVDGKTNNKEELHTVMELVVKWIII